MTSFVTLVLRQIRPGGILDWLGQFSDCLSLSRCSSWGGSLIEPTAAAGSVLTLFGINESGQLLALHNWMVAPIRVDELRGFLIVVLAGCAVNFIVADRRSKPRDGPAASARSAGMLLRMASIARDDSELAQLDDPEVVSPRQVAHKRAVDSAALVVDAGHRLGGAEIPPHTHLLHSIGPHCRDWVVSQKSTRRYGL